MDCPYSCPHDLREGRTSLPGKTIFKEHECPKDPTDPMTGIKQSAGQTDLIQLRKGYGRYEILVEDVKALPALVAGGK